MMFKKLHLAVLSAIMLLLSMPVFSAYLTNVPQTLTQPDNTVIHCYASGDEFHNWLHDSNDYTIIKNPTTGFWVYANKINGVLVPTNHVVGQVNPASFGLQPGLNISPAEWQQKRDDFLSSTPPKDISTKSGAAKNTGTLNNIVVYIRFSGETEFGDQNSLYDNMFNNSSPGYNSMYNYFREVSYNTLFMPSTFYPSTAGSTVVSYQDSYTRNYYKVYDAVTNPIGYSGTVQRRDREHAMLINAVNAIKSQIPTSLNIDYDNDGYVDNICFIVRGSAEGWSELLWPHRWALFSDTAFIHGKRVWDYNFQLQNSIQSIGVGVLSHEMFHTLGAPDLYRYTSGGITPVGIWDIMSSTQNPPQHMGAFMKFKYGGWISSIPEITTAGTYTLSPQTSATNNAYKIASPFSTTEYFVIEYRRSTGTFESQLPGSGLVVYRINTLAGNGNAQGPPDEVYVFRPNGDSINNGNIPQAFFSSNVNRTAINSGTNPSTFLSNGSVGGLNISNIGSAGTTINFTVNFVNAPIADFSASSTEVCLGSTVAFTDNSSLSPTSWNWSVNPSSGYSFVSGSSATSQNPSIAFTGVGSYSIKLVVSNANGTDSITKTNYINVSQGNTLPFSENFDLVTFPPQGWDINNPDNGITWARNTNATGVTGSIASAWMNFYSYTSTGALDDLISPAISLHGYGTARLTFKIAYRRYSANYFDGLKVYISTDCGASWSTNPVYDKSGTTLATGPDATNLFTPSSANDWRTDTIDLSAYLNQTVLLKFQAVNGYGNSLFLDDINVSGTPFYCIASGTNCGPTDEYISNVTFGNINKNSGCGMYEDYTFTDSTTVIPGNTYTLTVTNERHWTGDQMGCWIDWNRNGDFADAGEFYTITYTGSGNGSGSAPGTGTAQITVPTNATIGKTRMRIRLNYGAVNPCGVTTYGEVEDYSVVVASPTPAVIQLSQTSMTFTATVGNQQSQNINVSNTGGSPLIVSGIQMPAGFSVTPNNFTVNPGLAQTLTVTFTPTAVQTYSGNMVVSSNAASGSNTVSLSGQGTAPPQPLIAVNPSTLIFSTVSGTTQTQNVMVSNAGTAVLNVSNVQISSPFSALPLSFSIQPGDSLSVAITFSPQQVQQYTGQAQFVSNATTGNNIVSLQGNGTPVPAGILTANPTALNFGQVTIGTNSSLPIVISNTGNASLLVSNLILPSGFTVPAFTPFSLGPGNNQTINVVFTPLIAQTYSDTLTLISSANVVNMPVTGTGTTPPAPVIALSTDTLLFNTTVGNTQMQSINVLNTGNSVLTVSGIQLPQGFTASPTAFTVNPAASQLVAVSFSPLNVQTYSGNAMIFSDATLGQHSFYLSGTATPSPTPFLVVSPSPLSFGPVIVGTVYQLNLNVSNTGSLNAQINSVTTPPGFSINGSTSFSIAPGNTHALQVVFAPTSASTFAGNLVLNSNANPVSVPLTGSGIATPPAVINVNPPSLSFSSYPGIMESKNVWVKNTGSSTLNVTSVSLPAAFFANPTQFNVNAGDSSSVVVTFAPIVAQTYGGVVFFNSNSSGGNPILNITGIAVQPSSPLVSSSDTLSFGDIVENHSETRTFNLINTSSNPINVSGIILPQHFTTNLIAQTINPGAFIQVDVIFQPPQPGIYDGLASVISDTDTVWIYLKATGILESGINDIVNINSIVIYPNPAADYFIVEVKQAARVLLRLFDAGGRLLEEESAYGNIHVNTAGIANGVYFVEIIHLESHSVLNRSKIVIAR